MAKAAPTRTVAALAATLPAAPVYDGGGTTTVVLAAGGGT